MEFWVESKGVWEKFIEGRMFEMGHEGKKFHRLKWWKVFRSMKMHKQHDTDKKEWGVVKDPGGQRIWTLSREVMEKRT